MAVTLLDDKVFVGDVGTAFRATVKEDGAAINISAATTKNLLFEKPDGTIITRAGAFVTDGTDGLFQYLSVTNDLDIGGAWRIQGDLDMGSWVGKTDKVNFKVYDNLT